MTEKEYWDGVGRYLDATRAYTSKEVEALIKEAIQAERSRIMKAWPKDLKTEEPDDMDFVYGYNQALAEARDVVMPKE